MSARSGTKIDKATAEEASKCMKSLATSEICQPRMDLSVHVGGPDSVGCITSPKDADHTKQILSCRITRIAPREFSSWLWLVDCHWHWSGAQSERVPACESLREG